MHSPRLRKATLAFLLTLATGATLAQSATPPSATDGSSASPAVSPSDRRFIMKAASGGMAEVELGNLAQQKASNDQVKQFGARMVADHTKANDDLKQIASSKGLDVPTTLDKADQRTVDRLQKLSGADFDRAYMKDMVSDHKTDIAAFQKEARAGKDSDVRDFASKTLPTLQTHLQMAESTDKSL